MTVMATPGGIPDEEAGGLSRALTAITARMHRLLGGKGKVVLTTVGAQSGRWRSTHVRRFTEESGSILVVAAEAGAATQPSWFIDLVRNPESVWIEENGMRVRVTPTLLDGEELDEAWSRIVAEAPVWGADQDGTDAEIQVVRLTPISPGRR
jgi:deazaflavin-dependent oxidoreductase (nitroreductase family)